MSQKLFCDACGAELLRAESNVVACPLNTGLSGGVVVKVEAGWNEFNRGEICQPCAIDAVMALDKRMPKPQSPGEKRRIQVARKMANVLFNLSQSDGFKPGIQELAAQLYRDWDEAVKA